jgi:hypothetical protein
VAWLSTPRALGWWRAGLALLARAPGRVAAWSLFPLAVEVLLQLVPVIGIVASKLLTPVASAVTFLALDRIVRGQPAPPDALAAGLRRIGTGNLLGLALIGVAIYVLQLVVAYLAYGDAAIDLALLGRTAGHEALLADRGFLVLLVLVGLVPGVLLLFVTPLVVLGGRTTPRAVSLSAGAMLASPGAAAVTFALTALLIGTAIASGFGLVLLVLVPLLTAVYFAAYRDAFGEVAAPPPR